MTIEEIKSLRHHMNTSGSPRAHVAQVIALCDEVLAARITQPEELSAEEPLFKNAVLGRQLADDGSIIPASVVLATLEFYKKHPNGIPQEIVLAMIEELIWIRTAPKKEPPPTCTKSPPLRKEETNG